MKITLNDATYPVTLKGTGQPCLVIGIASLMERSLSEDFFNAFKCFFTDLYWVKEYGVRDPQNIKMDDIIDDIKKVIETLGLEKPILMAHSAYGIVALELAKKYPDLCGGLIIIGTPVNSNPQVAAQNNAIFEEEADERRKKIAKERRLQLEAEDLSGLSPSNRFKREYIFGAAPRYWHQPDYDCSALWEGLELDPLLDHFFAKILPHIDVTQGLENITIPVFHAVGLSDYDCCPWLWNNLPALPPHMINLYFEESGHWPHMEEAEKFNQEVVKFFKIDY